MYGFLELIVGNTASLQREIHQTPLLFSAFVISLENIPTSTAPERTSVNPLPAPPACTSNLIFGCVFHILLPIFVLKDIRQCP